MATGVYATNMEIEVLKKELADEANRLERLRRGERVSPAKPSRAPDLSLENNVSFEH
jgi:hypothetical protein